MYLEDTGYKLASLRTTAFKKSFHSCCTNFNRIRTKEQNVNAVNDNETKQHHQLSVLKSRGYVHGITANKHRKTVI